MAVPGPVTSMASSGTNRLLHEQVARAVSDSDEVVSLLTGCDVSLGGPGAAAGHGGTGPADLDGLPEEARAVLAALPSRGTRSVEDAAERAALTPAACLAHLGLLEIMGLARRSGSGWRRCP